MAKAETTELFPYEIEKLFSVIEDFESYPDFLSEVNSCKVVDQADSYTDIEMEVHMMKTAKYTIRAKKESPTKLWWELVEGDLFKKNNGLWVLEAVGSQTEVTYSLDVDFKIYVPGMIAKKAVSVSLPAMMKNFKNRIGSL